MTPLGMQAMRAAGVIAIAVLFFLMVQPFLPAVAWAFALAVIGEPLRRRLAGRLGGRMGGTMAAIVTELTELVLLIGPAWLVAVRVSAEITRGLRTNSVVPDAWRWVTRNLPFGAAPADLVGAAAGWISGAAADLISGSVALMTQFGIMLVVLFYFLRDGETILQALRGVLPDGDAAEAAFRRVAQTIRMSLMGKILVSSVQGALGGMAFWWLDLGAPVFWGLVMAVFSVIPVTGAFFIWAPVAVSLAAGQEWTRAIMLTVWGVAVIHPVDNILGPVVVGSALRLHTLVTLLAVIGGAAAFGPAGIVIGPVVCALAAEVVLRHTAQHRATAGGEVQT